MPSDFIDDFMNGDIIEAVHVHQTFEPIHNLEDGSAFYADDIGTVNAYKVDFSADNKVSTYTKGLVVNFKSLHANTGASTLTIAGPTGDLDPIALTKRGGEALIGDDIAEGQIVSAIYTEDEDENLDPINPRFEVIGGLTPSLSAAAWGVFSVLSSDLTLTDLADQDLPLGSRLEGDQLSINGNQRVTLSEGLYNVAFTVTCEINSGEALEVGLFDYSATTPVEFAGSTRSVIGHETLHYSPVGEAVVSVPKGSSVELGLRTGSVSVNGSIKAGGGCLKIIKINGGIYSSSGSVSSLDGLSDVEIGSTPSQGDVLRYDTTAGKFKPEALSINADNIASGTVDNTEFSYLNGVTSAIQEQLDGKQDNIVNSSGVLEVTRPAQPQQTWLYDGSHYGQRFVDSSGNMKDFCTGDGFYWYSAVSTSNIMNMTGSATTGTTLRLNDNSGGSSARTRLDFYYGGALQGYTGCVSSSNLVLYSAVSSAHVIVMTKATDGGEFRVQPRVSTTMFRVSNVGVGVNGNAPVAKASAISSPTADVTSLKTAVDAIRTAIANFGITS